MNSPNSNGFPTPHRTVLVVDDESDILRLLQTILAEEGYEVTIAKGAESAIKAFHKFRGRPDLLLVDVVMPGMSGPMLVDRLRQIDAGLKVLFMSGYDDRHVVQRYVVDKGFHLVAKPFTVSGLRSAIDEVMNNSTSASPHGSAR